MWYVSLSLLILHYYYLLKDGNIAKLSRTGQ